MSLINELIRRLRLRFIRWRILRVQNFYSIPVPRGYSKTFTEETQTLCITLPTTPRTETFIARWPFKGTDPADRTAAVRLLLNEFVTETLAKTEFRTFDRSEPGRAILQALVPVEIEGQTLDNSIWWLVRFEVTANGSHFFFIHWNGPYCFLKRIALVMFEGFEPH